MLLNVIEIYIRDKLHFKFFFKFKNLQNYIFTTIINSAASCELAKHLQVNVL